MRKNKSLQYRYINFTVVCLIFLPGINNFLNSLLQMGFLVKSIYLTPIVYIFLMLLCLGAYWLCLQYKIKYLSIALLIVIGMLISYVRYPEIRNHIYNNPIDLVYNEVNKVIFFSIPMLYLTYFINDYQSLFDRMLKWARINLVLGLSLIIIVEFIQNKTIEYMVYSYFMLVPICVCLENFRNKQKKIDLIIGMMGIMAIFVTGARGAIISLGMYLFLRVFLSNKKNRIYNNLIITIICLIALLLFYFYHKSILITIIEFLNKFNVSSRFFTSLLNNSLIQSSGRELIRSAILLGLRDRPVFGYGLFGDRLITGTYGYYTFTYAHNLFLELLSNFGYFLGIILIIVLIYQIFKLLHSKKEKYFEMVLFSILPFGLFQLFFSGSWLTNTLFFMLCGLMLSNRIHPKEKKHYWYPKIELERRRNH